MTMHMVSMMNGSVAMENVLSRLGLATDETIVEITPTRILCFARIANATNSSFVVTIINASKIF